MDILKFSFFFLFISCAKLSWMTEQGIGQAKLIFGARDNEEVLADPKIKERDKEKIRKIITYKNHFYKYWDREKTGNYDKTIMLDRDAVTYLVISSKENRVKAHRECFIFAGCFPYLGFFDVNSAKEYASKMQEDGFDTYIRKVPAYSLLGYMDDPIISTFFNYSEYHLAETIFHELFHSIFFIKNEVDLNENLANYIGKQMVYEYFGDSENLKIFYEYQKQSKKLMLKIVELGKILRKGLKGSNWRNFKENFFLRTFVDEMKKECLRLNISSCWPIKLKWNNATIAAYMTYEKNQDRISMLVKERSFDLKGLLRFLEREYEEYLRKEPDMSFETFLFSE